MYIDTPNVKISQRFAQKTGMIEREPQLQCTLCGEPLDGHQWCDRSTTGFHVRPLPNL